jgi:hypothetical protein
MVLMLVTGGSFVVITVLGLISVVPLLSIEQDGLPYSKYKLVR